MKSIAQQDLQLLQRSRSRLVCQRTALANQIRGIAAEYGVVFPPSLRSLRLALPLALEDADNTLVTDCPAPAHQPGRGVAFARAPARDADRATHAPRQPVTALVAPAQPPRLRSHQRRRDFSAWLGLVPRQHSSGERIRLRGITRNGDRALRTLLRWAARRDDPLARWAVALRERRGHNKAIVALANKGARIAWRLITHQEAFNVHKVVA